MLIVMPVAIKTHLHNVCAKNNYELLIVQEPAENAWSDGGGWRGRRVQDGCSCVQMEGQHWITAHKKQTWGAVRADTRQHRCRGIYLHSTKAFTLPNETDMYTLCFFFSLPLFVWLSFSSLLMGKWRVFGSYLDNNHIFPRSPSCFRGGSTSGPAIEPVRNPAVRKPFGTTLSSHCSRITGALWDKKQPKSIVSPAEWLSVLCHAFTEAFSVRRKPVR